MKKIKIHIPEENFSYLEFEQENLPGIAVINTALRDPSIKEVFTWHLSLMIQFEDLIENGMLSHHERNVIDPLEDKLKELIKGPDPEKPNALFLARITHNAIRELV